MTLTFQYEPYFQSISDASDMDKEIPCYRIHAWDQIDGQPDRPIAETSADMPEEVQRRFAYLFAASEDLRDALDNLLSIMHDYESSLAKGYVNDAVEKARRALALAKQGWV